MNDNYKGNSTEDPCGGNSWEYDPNTGNCYQLLESPMSWSRAREQCYFLPGRENNFIVSLLKQPHTWIGLTHSITKNQFVWADGSEASQFDNFGDGEPNNSYNKEHCVEIYKSGKWNDAICSSNKYGLCQLQFNLLAASAIGDLVNVTDMLMGAAMVDKRNALGMTSLMIAAKKGYHEIVKTLVEDKANTEVKDSDGCTSLMHAARNGHLEVVDILLSHNADINATNDEGWTSLIHAAYFGHNKVVKKLIEYGSFLEAKDVFYGDTSLTLAAKNGHFKVVKTLLTYEADAGVMNFNGLTALDNAEKCFYGNKCDLVTEILKRHGGSAGLEIKELIKFSKEGDITKVYQLLSEGTNVNGSNEFGWTSLLYAALKGNVELIKILLKHGAKVNARNHKGMTSLMFASSKGNKQLVNLLIQSNADINARDNYDKTSLMYAAKNGNPKVVNLLLEHSADVEAMDWEGQTSLWYATNYGHLEVVRILIENKANVNAKNKLDQTSLMYAAWIGRIDIVRILLKHGAYIEVKTVFGKTSLMYAAWKGYQEEVELLLQHGAKTDVVNEKGETALDFALKCWPGKMCSSIVEILKQNGARTGREIEEILNSKF